MTTESMYGQRLLLSRGGHRLGVRGRQPGRFACDDTSVQAHAPTPDQLNPIGHIAGAGHPSRSSSSARLGSAQLIFESEDYGG